MSSFSPRTHGHNRYKVSITSLLLWNALVGCGCQYLVYGPTKIITSNHKSGTVAISAAIGAFGVLGIVQMLYPIGGLMADIYYGRLKVIVLSIFSIWCGCLIGATAQLLYAEWVFTAAILLETLTFLVLIIGFSGFNSNSVQLCLDQLKDESSERIRLFLRWFVWTTHVGNVAAKSFMLILPYKDKVRHTILSTVGAALAIICTAALTFTLCVRRQFHHERTSSNPYWNVWKVVKFAVQHGKPLGHRSAFTYADHKRPTRMDFAKRIYGGPFETEAVEDVKTFLRILVTVFAISTVFILEVPTSFLFPLYGRHLGRNETRSMIAENYKWSLFESGMLSEIIPVLAIPVYLLVVYPYIKKCLPRMTIRLGICIMLKVVAVISMFTIQTVANYTALQNPSTNITCFLSLNNFVLNASYPTLDFPTEVLVIPNILNGVAEPLISIAVLELISAQSPHTMKGLLLGVFYAFRGLFLTLGSVTAIPFAVESLWGDQHGMLDCGFYYYLSNSVFGVFGLVVFILAARWYRYRERDDPPYSHKYAEDYYSRHEDQLQESYGTFDS